MIETKTKYGKAYSYCGPLEYYHLVRQIISDLQMVLTFRSSSMPEYWSLIIDLSIADALPFNFIFAWKQ